MPYVELHACSAFSFLRGGSFPEHLAARAAELQLPGVALLDRDGVYGVQRFSVAARENGVRPIVGCELTMEDGAILPVLVESRTGYKNLCELLTQAHLRNEKGKCAMRWSELPEFAEGLVTLLGRESTAQVGGIHRIARPPGAVRSARAIGINRPYQNVADRAQLLIDTFGRNNVFVEIQRHLVRGENQA